MSGMVKKGYRHFSFGCMRIVSSHTLPLSGTEEQPINTLSSDDSNMGMSFGPSCERFEACARKYIVSLSITLSIAFAVSHRRATSWTNGNKEGVILGAS